MQAPFPHHYQIDLNQADAGTAMLGDGKKPEIKVGFPPQFGGSRELWSPEELLLGSVESCLMTTFFALVGKNPLEVISYQSQSNGILNKSREGIYFEQIDVQVELQVKDSDVDPATHLLNAAKRYCIVANALKTHVNFHFDVKGASEDENFEAA